MENTTMMQKLGLDKEEWAEILALFVETTLSDLDGLDRAIEEEDPVPAVRASHSIKGVAANLGFDEIASLAEALEEKARRGALEGAQDAVAEIRKKLDRLR